MQSDIPVIRRIDDLGRVVIPKAMRERLGIEVGDAFSVSCTDTSVVFTPLPPDSMLEHTLQTLLKHIDTDTTIDTATRDSMRYMTQNMLLALRKTAAGRNPNP